MTRIVIQESVNLNFTPSVNRSTIVEDRPIELQALQGNMMINSRKFGNDVAIDFTSFQAIKLLYLSVSMHY